MPRGKSYKEFVSEQLNGLDNITCKPMMGEYLLYYNNVLFGGIYDDRLLVKKTISNAVYKMSEVIPYSGAKPMFFIDCVDDKDKVKEIVLKTYEDLLKNKGNRNVKSRRVQA